MTRLLNNIRFLWKDKLVKYSATWLLGIMLVSIVSILSLQLNIDIWPYLPYPSEGLKTVFLSLAYSYVVSYVFFLLTIVFPRIIKILHWYGLTVARFRLFYEAWAIIYLCYHFAFSIGNRIVVMDLMVHKKAKNSNISALCYTNRVELGLNLRNALNMMESFSQLVNNQIDTLPSELGLLLQEVTYNPVRSSVNTIIEILFDERVTSDNAISYVTHDVLTLGEHFTNLKNLSEMLGYYKELKKTVVMADMFDRTANQINWVK